MPENSAILKPIPLILPECWYQTRIVWTEMKYGSFQRYIISEGCKFRQKWKNSRNHLVQVCHLKQISVSLERRCRSWFRRPGRKRTYIGISAETSPDRNSFLLYVQNHHEFLLASRTQQFKSVRNMLIDPSCGGTHF